MKPQQNLAKSLGVINFSPRFSILQAAIIFLCLCFLIQAAHPQENTPEEEVHYFTLRGGLGTSNILVRGTSFGLIFDTNFRLVPGLAVGIRSGATLSTDEIISLETEAYARWYFWNPKINLRFYQKTINLFTQGGIGLLTAYKGTEVQNSRASLMFDATVGVTIPLFDKMSIEPSVHFGYPFIAGFSLTVGYRFPSLTKVKYNIPPPEEIIKWIKIPLVEYIIFAADVSKYNEGLDTTTCALNDLILNQIIKTLTEHPEFWLRIEGYANPVTGDPDEILELKKISEDRANEIAEILKSRGVKEEQIVLIAHGGTRAIPEPIKNRRVELIVIQVDAKNQEDNK